MAHNKSIVRLYPKRIQKPPMDRLQCSSVYFSVATGIVTVASTLSIALVIAKSSIWKRCTILVKVGLRIF